MRAIIIALVVSVSAHAQAMDIGRAISIDLPEPFEYFDWRYDNVYGDESPFVEVPMDAGKAVGDVIGMAAAFGVLVPVSLAVDLPMVVLGVGDGNVGGMSAYMTWLAVGKGGGMVLGAAVALPFYCTKKIVWDAPKAVWRFVFKRRKKADRQPSGRVGCLPRAGETGVPPSMNVLQA